MRFWSAFFLTLLLPLEWCWPQLPATRPTTTPATAYSPTRAADTPKDALRALNVSLRDGDAVAVRELFHTSDSDGAKLIAAMADYAAALVVLHQASEKVYGPAGANTVTGDINAQSAEGLIAIDKADVSVTGDSAAVKFAGATDPPVKLVKVDGSWKLPLSQLLVGSDTAAQKRRCMELSTQAELARKTADEVIAGKYKEGALKAAEVWRSRLLDAPSRGPAKPEPGQKP